MLVWSMKCNRGQLHTAKMWAWIVKIIWTGKSMFVIMTVPDSDLRINAENIHTTS